MAELLKVKYVGPKMAILAGRAIYNGETREVSAGQLKRAQELHPNGFEIMGPEAEAEALAEAVDLAGALEEVLGENEAEEDDEKAVWNITTADAESLEAEIEATEQAAELAKERGLSLEEIEGTGAGGRILKSDVEKAIAAEEPKEPAD